MEIFEEEYTPRKVDYLDRSTSYEEMKRNRPKSVSFSKQKFIHLVEHRNELTSAEKSNTWYTSDECYSMAKKAGIDLLMQATVDMHIPNSRDESTPSTSESCKREETKREETRGLEQYQSLIHYKSFKNARKDRIKAVLEAQKALRTYGVKDHSWAIHVACARESISSTSRAVSLGLSDQAEAFAIYKEG